MEKYPEFLPGVKGCATRGDIVEMTVSLGPIDVSWKSKAVFNPYESIVIDLVEGPFRQMDVRWEFTSQGDKTQVKYVTDFELNLRVPGISRIAARAIAANTDATLKAFRRRVLRSERSVFCLCSTRRSLREYKTAFAQAAARRYSGDDEMSLLASLADLTAEEAAWRLNDTTWTIGEILYHLYSCEIEYCKQGFGQSIPYDKPLDDVAALLALLDQAHALDGALLERVPGGGAGSADPDPLARRVGGAFLLDHGDAPRQPRGADSDAPPGVWLADALLSDWIGRETGFCGS